MSWTVASDIAERIKELRRFLGTGSKGILSQEELGKRAGVRPSQVSQWERGVQQPSKSRLESWAEREGWPVTIFAEGAPRPSQAMSSVGGSPAVPGTSAIDEREPGSLDPAEILARFYRLMAAAAEHGRPWPPELASLMDEMYRAAKRDAPQGGVEAAGAQIPGW